MSAPAETKAKLFAPVVEGSSVVPAETAFPAKEYKKMEGKMEGKMGAKMEETKPIYPVPTVEEGRMEAKTDPPAEENPAEKRARGAKVTHRLTIRIAGLFKKEAKVNEGIPVVAKEAPKLAEVATVSAPLYEPTYPIPAVEEGRMETETALKPVKEKPEGKRARNAKVSRRISARVAGFFIGGKGQG